MKRRDFFCLSAGGLAGFFASKLMARLLHHEGTPVPVVGDTDEDYDLVLQDAILRCEKAEPRIDALTWLIVLEAIVAIVRLYCQLTRDACRRLGPVAVLRLKRQLMLRDVDVDRAVPALRLVANQASDEELDRFIAAVNHLAKQS